MRKDHKLGVAVVLVLGIVIVAYEFLHKNSAPAGQSSTNLTGPFTYATGYDPTGGLSVANIGGSPAAGGTANGPFIAGAIGTTPIGVNKQGQAINTVESAWAHQDVYVNPSSWQGTVNNSGSLTYLQGELAGEGSGPIALQGVTY